MTQVQPPPYPVTQHTVTGPSPSRAYPVAPVTGLNPAAANPTFAIPYPGSPSAGLGSNLPRQTVPVVMSHCVLANSSPYTLLVTQGGNMTQIPAFTADDVVLLEGQQGAPIMVQPLATSATVAAGVDTSVYATWYDGDPPGIYPAVIGAGSIPLSQQTALVQNTVTAASLITQTVQVPSWAQAVSFRIDQTAGAANGFQANVSDAVSGSILFQNICFFDNQWVFAPVGGRNVILNINALIGGAAGGTITGTLYVSAMSGPITNVVLGGVNDATPSAIGPMMGLCAELVGAAAGTTPIINRCATGFIVRLHTITMRMTTAPAAGAQVHVRGNDSGRDYVSWEAPGALPCFQSFPMNGAMVGQGITADGNEQLNVVNSTAQTVSVAITYDVIPTPWY